MFDDKRLSYTAGLNLEVVSAGDFVFVMEGSFTYKVAGSGVSNHDVITSGGVKLYVTDEGSGTVCPEMWGDTTGDDASPMINAALAWVVSNEGSGRSSGTYNIQDTIAPGGKYSWHWGNTTLNYNGSDISALTEALENPLGSTSPQGSGKYVLFDTSGCARSSNTGRLRIRGSSRNNMRVASAATIEANLIAMTAATSSSAEMSWESLEFLGCGEGLWQGDMRGTGAVILPYTGWVVKSLTMQFMLRCIRGGQSGNAFDDANWGVVRLKRPKSFGVVRSDFNFKQIFLNALQETGTTDTEDQTITFPRVNASDNSFTTNAAASISVGDIIHVFGGNLSDSGASIPFVSRVTSYSHPNGTTESVPDQSATSKKFFVNPTSPLLITVGSMNGLLNFMEEGADSFIHMGPQASYNVSQTKVSDGRCGCRYNTPIVALSTVGCSIRTDIHEASNNSNKVKAIVGIAPLQGTTGDEEWTYAAVHLSSSIPSSDWTDNPIVRAVELESDSVPANHAVRFNDLHPGTYHVTVSHSDGIVTKHISGLKQDSFKEGPNGPIEIGSNLRSNDVMTGVTTTGADTSLSSGQVTKTISTPEAGTCYEAVTASEGDRIRVKTVVSSLTGSINVRVYDNTGTNISPRLMRIRGAGTYYTFFDAPSGIDRVGIEFPTNTEAVVDELVVQIVESI